MPKIQPLTLCLPAEQNLFGSSSNPLYGPALFTDLLFVEAQEKKLIRSAFESTLKEGKIKKLEHPAILWYVVQKGNQWFSGFVTGIPIEEIQKGKISLHENIIQGRVDEFTRHLSSTRIQAEPVLLFHKDHEGINSLEDEICKRSPDHYFRLDNERHELWMLSKEQEKRLQEHCLKLPYFHLADGHHRLQSTLQWAGKNKEVKSLLSFIISKKEVSNGSFIWGIKRWPKGLNSNKFLSRLMELGAKPSNYNERLGKDHQILIEMENKVYALNPHEEKDHADFVYTDLLGFSNTAIDNTKNYFDYFPNRTELDFDAVSSDKYCVKIAMIPLSIDRLTQRALANEKLPPKSTFIRPKIPTGLLIVDQDKNN